MTLDKPRIFKAAKAVSLVAALALVAQSEWALALAVGWPAWIAWAAALALDAYVLAAVTAHRDLGASVVVSAASVVGSHAVYASPAAWTSGVVGQGHLLWWLAAACSVVPLLVTWRVHHLQMAQPETAPVAVLQPAPMAVPAPVVEQPAPAPAAPPMERPAARKPQAPARPAVVPDAELARIVRESVTKHTDGWGTVKAAIEAAGYSVGGTARVKAAISQRKADLPDEPRRGLTAVGSNQ